VIEFWPVGGSDSNGDIFGKGGEMSFKKIAATFCISLVGVWGLEVGVSIPPEKGIVERIGGERVQVEVLLPEGSSPVTYTPPLQKLMKYRKIPLFFSIGVPFEKRLIPKLRELNPNLKVVDIGRYLHRLKRGGVPDPHIWLSPPLLLLQGEVVLEELIKRDPTNKGYYLENFRKFVAEVEKLEEMGWRKIHQHAFLTFHPSFSYFAETYNLKQLWIEGQQNSGSLAFLRQLVEEARRLGVKRVFIAPEFPTRFAEVVARQIGAKVVVISPLRDPFKTIPQLIEELE
jgi:zinc transport system substrate-binding protein